MSVDIVKTTFAGDLSEQFNFAFRNSQSELTW